MKKSTVMTFASLVSAAALAAVPRVDENTVTISQDASRAVTVTYTLTQAAGIVTVDFQTNCVTGAGETWASIGAENFQNLAGDVNCIVTELDVAKTITWRPDISWGGHKIKDGVRAVVKAWALDDPPEYVAFNLSADGAVRFYSCAAAVPGGITHMDYKTDWLLMRKIPAANVIWRMGSPVGEMGKTTYDDAKNERETPHLVRLSENYYMAVYETTQQQYLRIMQTSTNPSGKQTAADHLIHPVEYVSWTTLRGDGEKGKDYEWPTKEHDVSSESVMGTLRSRWPNQPLFDLPTEAQWEFACRAGCGSALYNGKELTGNYDWQTVSEIGWVKDSTNTTVAVGRCEPNAWGLYDTIGNVSEWCLDWWAQMTETIEIVPGKIYEDPVGELTGKNGVRTARGGSYDIIAANSRCAARSTRPAMGTLSTSIGFRVCCPAKFVIP